MNDNYKLKIDASAIYQIKVQGKLERSHSKQLNDMQISYQKKGEKIIATLLIGQVADQAELSGILSYLYEFRMPVLSVECLDKV